MAEASASNPLQQLTSVSQMHMVRQVLLLVGLAGSIALGVAVVMWAQQSDYRLLFSGLGNEDLSRITAALDQSAADYRIDHRSGDIMVPASKVGSIRMMLSSAGLPKKQSQGFSILAEEPDMGGSQNREKELFKVALQQELQQTISSLDGISDVRVHLSVPNTHSFLRSRLKPSASIMLNLMPGFELGRNQIAGVRHLVAASVVGMPIENVSVVDQRGSLLSMDDEAGDFAELSRNLQQQRALEQEYTARIVRILEPIVGMGRVEATVNADLDFTRTEITEEDYDPEPILRSEQRQSEKTSEDYETGGVPGLLEDDLNAGPGNDALDEEPVTIKEKTSSTLNYERDLTLRHIQTAPGGIKRLSVAVLIDYPQAEVTAEAPADPAADQARRESYLRLVESAIGFDAERGDVVTLEDFDFQQEEVLFEAAEPSIMDNPMLWKSLRMGGAGLVVLLLIFGVLRPILRSAVAANNGLPQRNPMGSLGYAGAAGVPQGMEQPYGAEDQVTLTGGNPGNRLAGPSGVQRYESNLEQVRSIVETEPGRAAKVIQDWVADD